MNFGVHKSALKAAPVGVLSAIGVCVVALSGCSVKADLADTVDAKVDKVNSNIPQNVYLEDDFFISGIDWAVSNYYREGPVYGAVHFLLEGDASPSIMRYIPYTEHPASGGNNTPGFTKRTAYLIVLALEKSKKIRVVSRTKPGRIENVQFFNLDEFDDVTRTKFDENTYIQVSFPMFSRGRVNKASIEFDKSQSCQDGPNASYTEGLIPTNDIGTAYLNGFTTFHFEACVGFQERKTDTVMTAPTLYKME